mmetsp:Transcript_40862/g.78049  ORF Transcript_40862/g.78049 Transcript_40862/m.78049 type:complete len:408 (-) Transcript_40862:95-1318(-)
MQTSREQWEQALQRCGDVAEDVQATAEQTRWLRERVSAADAEMDRQQASILEKQHALEKRVVESFASEMLDLNMKLEETETRLVNLDTMGAKMKNHLERIDEQLDAGRTESEMCTKIELDQRQELELMVHKLVEEKQSSEAATEHRLATMEQVVESCTSTLRKFHTSLKQDLDHLARAVYGEEGDAATATHGMTARSRSTDGYEDASTAGASHGLKPLMGGLTKHVHMLKRKFEAMHKWSIDLDQTVANLQMEQSVLAGEAQELNEKTNQLVQANYQRVDEHASAIQKLSNAISMNMKDRPTTAAVRRLLAEAVGSKTEVIDLEKRLVSLEMVLDRKGEVCSTKPVPDYSRIPYNVQQSLVDYPSLPTSPQAPRRSTPSPVAVSRKSPSYYLRQQRSIASDHEDSSD